MIQVVNSTRKRRVSIKKSHNKNNNNNNTKRSTLALELTIKNYLHAFIICLRVYSIKHYDFYRLLSVPFANLLFFPRVPFLSLSFSVSQDHSNGILFLCAQKQIAMQQMESNQRQRQCHQFISIYNKRFLSLRLFLWHSSLARAFNCVRHFCAWHRVNRCTSAICTIRCSMLFLFRFFFVSILLLMRS